MPDLKLDKLPDRTPVKITITVSPDLSRALTDYAEIYRSVYGQREKVEELIPFGVARVARTGSDCTIVTWGRPYHVAMAAADKLAPEGIDCEIIDPRTLRPLDLGPVIESVAKTNRCVVVHEHWPYGGPGAEIVDQVQHAAFDHLDAPIERIAGLDVPMPYALNLEEQVLPTEERVIDAVKRVSYAN